MNKDFEHQKKLLEAKMLLDTFEIPNRPRALSAHQYKKKHGSNQGYAAYKADINRQRKKWDELYKDLAKLNKKKNKYLAEVDLSDDALVQAEREAKERGLSIGEILTKWIEKGRNS